MTLSSAGDSGLITVAVTTYDRIDIVYRALQSALTFASAVDGKVVLVDDASTDDTQASIKSGFRAELDDGSLVLLRHEVNLGVTAAKNTAFAHSPAGWVLFLDSDDELIQEAASAVAETLSNHRHEALIFFRCIDEHGALVGTPFADPQRLSLPRYLKHTSYGEALVAINKAVAPEAPFDADLRGYEGIGCAGLIQRFGPALLSPVIARRYDRSRNDRLSGLIGTLRRAGRLSQGHARYIKLYRQSMPYSTQFSIHVKVLVYSLAALLASIRWFRNG